MKFKGRKWKNKWAHVFIQNWRFVYYFTLCCGGEDSGEFRIESQERECSSALGIFKSNPFGYMKNLELINKKCNIIAK